MFCFTYFIYTLPLLSFSLIFFYFLSFSIFFSYLYLLVFVSIEGNIQNNERTWTITFLNAGYQLPLFSVTSLLATQNALVSFENRNNQQNTETIIRNSQEIRITIIFYFHQFISENFELSVGNRKFQISSNISAEDLGSVLESVSKVCAVGVVRSALGLDGGYRWIITVYYGLFLYLFISLIFLLFYFICFIYYQSFIVCYMTSILFHLFLLHKYLFYAKNQYCNY